MSHHRKRSQHKSSVKKGIISRFFRSFGRFCRGIFCQRSIIIISEHQSRHVPVSIRHQLTWIVAFLAIVVWVSYSTGSYMKAQEQLAEKEKEIANTSLENRRIESEFALLKRDLVSMLDQEKPEDLSEYAQFVIAQYRENGESIENIDIDLEQLSNSKHGAVFQRISFLEKQVAELKQNHQDVINAIRATMRGRLNELETIVRRTGLNLDRVHKDALNEINEEIAGVADVASDAEQSLGGPFDPYAEDILKAYDAKLYKDIRRFLEMDQITRHLPLDAPMQEYRLTSGYGTRIDPFRKRKAHHAGLDFAGENGAEIYAANDGIVTHAGRKGAYGNLVEISHGIDLKTRYGHMRQILVEEGQEVTRGEIIGIQGSTGRSTGAHLHYEVRYKGATLDPENFLKAGNYARKVEEKRKQ